MTTCLWSLVVALDQFANVLLAPALNATLHPTAARFGHPDETLSSVLGKNVEAGACVGCRLICRLLHRIDPGHCEKCLFCKKWDSKENLFVPVAKQSETYAHRACMNEYNRGSRIKNKTRVTHAE